MYPTSARFREVVAGSHRAVVRVQLLTGSSVPQFTASPTGGTELPVLSGDVQLSSTSDVKGSVDITVPGDYWELLAPFGAELFVERGVSFGDGTQELVPLGYYRIQEVEQERPPYGPVRVIARDRMAHLIDSRLIYPWQYPAGTTHAALFDKLVNDNPSSEGTTAGGLGMYITEDVPIIFEGYDGTVATLPAGVVEDSTYEYLAKIADARSCVLRFDRLGRLCITARDRAPGTPAVYHVRPGRTGNLISARRRMTRDGVYNMVVARGSDPAAPAVGLSYNDDPTSPLYWNGSFGVITRYYSSPLLKTPAAADAASDTILARYKGLPSSTAVATVPDPSLEPLDPVDITLGPTVEAHLIDELTIPLVGSAPVEITTRTLNEVPDDPGSGAGEVPEEPGGEEPGGEDPGTGTPVGTTMAQILKIGPTAGYNHFNLGVGFEPSDPPGVHKDYGQSEIANGLDIPDYATAVNGRVRLTAHLLGGRTSNNTKYPRTEYRELKTDGTTRAAWSSSSGRHYMKWRFRVLSMPPGKPQMCVGQIHGGSDDVAMIRLDSKTTLNARFGDTEVVGTLTDAFAFDTDYDAMLEVVGGSTCTINYYFGPADNLPATPNFSRQTSGQSGWYFKTGAYGQSFATVDNEADSRGEPTDQNDAPNFILEMSKLECWHTGYPEPLGWSDSTGGGTTDPEPEPGGGSTGNSPVPASASLIFSSDMESRTGWSTFQSAGKAYSLQFVNDGSGHETAARFEVRSGDTAISGERSELRFPSAVNINSNGAVRWIEFDLKFAEGFQGVSTSAWLIVMQLHPDDGVGGSPQWDLTVREDETLRLRLHETQYVTIGDIDAGKWHRYTIRSEFSTSGGSHDIWRDGVKVASASGTSLKSSSGNYFKLGIYRKAQSFTSALFYDRVRMWSE